MISSRCNDPFPANARGKPLSEVRKKIKQAIERQEVFGEKLFEVWINEDTPPQPGSVDSWEACLKAARECDVFIALSNGNAGWGKEGGDVGICHAELMTALSQTPGKVRLIDLGTVAPDDTAQGHRNRRFQEYVGRESLFRGGTVSSIADLEARIGEAIHDALLTLAQAGVRESSKGRFHRGEALHWSHLSFLERRSEMRRILRDAMLEKAGARKAGDEGELVFARLADTDVLLVPDAIPERLSVAPAKELVGQPFLHDHRHAPLLRGEKGGPVHVIACHKSATETQATKLLGFPDATVVKAPFGIFVADDVQKVQFAFIVECRDETTTRHGAQRFFEWLLQSGEEGYVARRARARARIVRAIAKEQGDTGSA